MANASAIRSELAEANSDAVLFDGLDAALVGIGMQHTNKPLAVYSAQKIVGAIMLRDGMYLDDAIEFYEFNIAGLWAGPGTPIILQDI